MLSQVSSTIYVQDYYLLPFRLTVPELKLRIEEFLIERRKKPMDVDVPSELVAMDTSH